MTVCQGIPACTWLWRKRERVLRKKRPVLKALTLGVRKGGTPLIRLPEPNIVGNQGGRDWPKVVQL